MNPRCRHDNRDYQSSHARNRTNATNLRAFTTYDVIGLWSPLTNLTFNHRNQSLPVSDDRKLTHGRDTSTQHKRSNPPLHCECPQDTARTEFVRRLEWSPPNTLSTRQH